MKRLFFNFARCILPPVLRHDIEREKRKWQATPEWKRYFEIPILFGAVVRHWATGRWRLVFWTVIGNSLVLTVVRVADVLTGERYPAALGRWWGIRYRGFGLPWPDAAGLVLVVLLLASAVVVGYAYAMLIIRFIDHRRIPFGFCRKCRYDLRGAESVNCPECGTPRLHSAKTQVTTTPST